MSDNKHNILDGITEFKEAISLLAGLHIQQSDNHPVIVVGTSDPMIAASVAQSIEAEFFGVDHLSNDIKMATSMNEAIEFVKSLPAGSPSPYILVMPGDYDVSGLEINGTDNLKIIGVPNHYNDDYHNTAFENVPTGEKAVFHITGSNNFSLTSNSNLTIDNIDFTLDNAADRILFYENENTNLVLSNISFIAPDGASNSQALFYSSNVSLNWINLDNISLFSVNGQNNAIAGLNANNSNIQVNGLSLKADRWEYNGGHIDIYGSGASMNLLHLQNSKIHIHENANTAVISSLNSENSWLLNEADYFLTYDSHFNGGGIFISKEADVPNFSNIKLHNTDFMGFFTNLSVEKSLFDESHILMLDGVAQFQSSDIYETAVTICNKSLAMFTNNNFSTATPATGRASIQTAESQISVIIAGGSVSPDFVRDDGFNLSQNNGSIIKGDPSWATIDGNAAPKFENILPSPEQENQQMPPPPSYQGQLIPDPTYIAAGNSTGLVRV